MWASALKRLMISFTGVFPEGPRILLCLHRPPAPGNVNILHTTYMVTIDTTLQTVNPVESFLSVNILTD